jgi:ABC-type sugar transport system ATPase subunit
MPPLLEIRNLSKSFGPTHALRGANFLLQAGEIHALVGENGAGKSTLIKILAGAHAMDSGEILLDGKPTVSSSPRAAREQGISTVFQELSLCPNLTVAENILANREPTFLGLVKKKELHRLAEQYLTSFGVQLKPDALVGNLSVAQRQIIEILKAISVRARVLIFDEPTSALDDREAQRLLDLIRSLKRNGTGIIYVSHKLNEVFQVADTITVFRDGEHISTLPRSETRPEEIIQTMVGREITQIYPPRATDTGKEKLRLRGFSNTPQFQDVAFSLREGEILGIAGLTGSGRTEVMQSLFGYRPREEGEIFYRGEPITIHHPAHAIRRRIVYSPEDRKELGLFLQHSVTMNVTSTCLDQCSGVYLMSATKERTLTQGLVDDLSIKVESLQQEVASLSGGNQQKVLLAKCLATRPDVLIVDEPTRGIDIGSKIEIYTLLRKFVRNGCSVIFISSELQELIGLSDRIIVFRKGRVVGELSETITEQALLELMFMHTTGSA